MKDSSGSGVRVLALAGLFCEEKYPTEVGTPTPVSNVNCDSVRLFFGPLFQFPARLLHLALELLDLDQVLRIER